MSDSKWFVLALASIALSAVLFSLASKGIGSE